MDLYNILIVEDEKEIAMAIEVYLTNQGYKVFKAYNGLEGLELLEKENIHLAIVDMMMPKMNGTEFIMKVRQNYSFPIIVLSAKSEDMDKILGLNIGADDYITKPFSPRELLARIEATLRRSHRFTVDQSSTLTLGMLELDTESRSVHVNGKPVSLTRKEFDLLHLFAQNNDKVFSREQLLDQIWGADYIGNLRTVDTHIKTLRLKLGEAGGSIQTVWGIGYKFEEV